MLMGSYQGWGGRNYNGQIDEVCIWKRALTQDEIRDHRHLTKENLIETDSDIIAYYQFNEEEGRILDKVGISHASLKGNALRVFSSAPLGGGTSDRQNIAEGGTYNFENTGFIKKHKQIHQINCMFVLFQHSCTIQPQLKNLHFCLLSSCV